MHHHESLSENHFTILVRKNVRKETAFLGWETGQNTLVLQERSTTTIARQRYHNGKNLGSGWNVSALEIRPEIGKLTETIAAVAVVPHMINIPTLGPQ